jgi:hypothetical protein
MWENEINKEWLEDRDFDPDVSEYDIWSLETYS